MTSGGVGEPYRANILWLARARTAATLVTVGGSGGGAGSMVGSTGRTGSVGAERGGMSLSDIPTGPCLGLLAVDGDTTPSALRLRKVPSPHESTPSFSLRPPGAAGERVPEPGGVGRAARVGWCSQEGGFSGAIMVGYGG